MYRFSGALMKSSMKKTMDVRRSEESKLHSQLRGTTQQITRTVLYPKIICTVLFHILGESRRICSTSRVSILKTLNKIVYITTAQVRGGRRIISRRINISGIQDFSL